LSTTIRTHQTATLQPNERDINYSRYRPDLHAFRLRDGFVPSGIPTDNNDELSRRDQGLEFLDVRPQLMVEPTGSSLKGRRRTDDYRITNRSASVVDAHLLVTVRGLPSHYQLENASGITRSGDPYLRGSCLVA
jgi:hypothetical protein